MTWRDGALETGHTQTHLATPCALRLALLVFTWALRVTLGKVVPIGRRSGDRPALHPAPPRFD